MRPHLHRRCGYSGVPQQCGLDFAELDAESAQLDLEVRAAQVLQLPCGVPSSQVAGAVHPVTGCPEGVGDEPAGGQVRTAEVAAGQLTAVDVHLTLDADRGRAEPGVEDVDAHSGQSAADDTRRGFTGELAVQWQIADVHRRLGDAVHVHQSRRVLRMTGVPAVELTEVQRLAAEDHISQTQSRGSGPVAGDGDRLLPCDPVGFGELIERRRRLVEHGDPFPAQQRQEVLRRPRGHEVDDDERPAVEQRAPQFPHGEVEGVAVEHRPHVGLIEPELGLGVHHEGEDVRVRDDDTLRTAGGTGRVDHVGRVLRGEPARAFGICHGLAGHLSQAFDRFPGVEQDSANVVVRQSLCILASGQHHDRLRVGQHVGEPVLRVGDVDRNIGTAGRDDGQQRDYEVGGARHRHGDHRFRPDPFVDQDARKPVHPIGELPVGQPLAARHDGRAVGIVPRAFGEHCGEGRGGHLDTGVDPPGQDHVPLGGVEDIDRRDALSGVLHKSGEDPENAAQ